MGEVAVNHNTSFMLRSFFTATCFGSCIGMLDSNKESLSCRAPYMSFLTVYYLFSGLHFNRMVIKRP